MKEVANDERLIELSNGVVLRFKEVSKNEISYAARNANRDYPEPKPPMIYIKNRGREEPNTNDPDYKQALLLYNIEATARIMDVMYARAIKVESRPDDISGPDSQEFQDYLELAQGETLRKSELGRLVQWLRYWAIPDEDQIEFQRKVLRLAGVPVADVVEIEPTFQGDTGGKPDTGSADIESDKNGD